MQIEILDFSPDIISGLLREAGERPVKLQLLVDGLVVAGNWGIPSPNQGEQTFRFNLSAIWSYIGSLADLQIRANDCSADLPPPNFAHTPEFNLEDLKQKLEAGYVFNEKGKLQLSKTVDTAWQSKMFALFDGMSTILAKKNLKLFVMYGTLLGAYRNGNFIGHDHDFDAGYISGHTDASKVLLEFTEVAESLAEHGYRVVCKLSCIWVTDPKSGVTIDIFHTFFDESGVLLLPFGICGVKHFMRSDFRGYVELELAGRKVPAIADTQILVESIYGPHWKTPNPGHNWDLDRTEKYPKGYAKQYHRGRIYWANHYAHNRQILPPSSFAEFISQSGYLQRHIVDVGCGNGRDSRYLATGRRTVIGIDNCSGAIRAAQAHVASNPKGVIHFLKGLLRKQPDLSFVQGDVADPKTLTRLLRTIRPWYKREGITLYSRFLLHAITRIQQDAFLQCASNELRKGDTVAFEFRTDQDESLAKKHKYFGRRFIRPEAVERQMAELGFQLLERQEGTGFSPHLGEDPHLCRLVFFKAG
ncbi:methyltransferase domain-containing protein [Shinella sp. S4-D37]|uniref:class I SAM-dependent methyltransferase n=1 Tax=Shinella sp. S4-D37 TaxID=3161999 RepID=UPI0034675AB0